MSDFVDTTLVALADPAQLKGLLAPPEDVTQARIRALLSAVYDFPFGTLHEIRNLKVTSIERERPLFPPKRTRGNWTRTIPNHSDTDVVYEKTAVDNPVWIDLSASVALVLILELDPGEVQSILLKEIEGFTSLADFKSRFRFLNLNDFLKKHKITTVDELREAYRYLRAEVRLKPLGAFNPADPANQHAYALNVAVLIRDSLDVANVVRDVKLVRLAAERSMAYRRQTDSAEVRSPIAPLLVLPKSALDGKPFTEAAIRAFFAAERIEVIFRP